MVEGAAAEDEVEEAEVEDVAEEDVVEEDVVVEEEGSQIEAVTERRTTKLIDNGVVLCCVSKILIIDQKTFESMP